MIWRVLEIECKQLVKELLYPSIAKYYQLTGGNLFLGKETFIVSNLIDLARVMEEVGEERWWSGGEGVDFRG